MSLAAELTAKLTQIERTYEESTRKLADPATLADPKALRGLTKQISELEDLVRLFSAHREAERQLGETQSLLADLSRGDERAEVQKASGRRSEPAAVSWLLATGCWRLARVQRGVALGMTEVVDGFPVRAGCHVGQPVADVA